MTTEAALLLVGNLLVVIAVAGVGGLLLYSRLRQIPPVAYARFEETLSDMQTRLERTEQRSDRQQAEIDRLRELLAAEQDFNRALVRAMRDAGLEPPPRPEAPPAAPAPASGTDTAKRLAAAFSVSELDDLAMELGLLEVVGGDSLEERASSLAMAAIRRGSLFELRQLARRHRPRGGF